MSMKAGPETFAGAASYLDKKLNVALWEETMKKNSTSVLKILAVFFALAGMVFAAGQAPAKPVDMKKILTEISGDYDFDQMGQQMTITFFEKDGKLMGGPVGEAPEELSPMKGDNPLKFDITTSGGQYYELEFVRNESGQIDKCNMKTQGMDVVGKKKAKAD